MRQAVVACRSCLRRCLEQPRYPDAERLFLIVDNGTSHHPSTSPARLQAQFPPLSTVPLSVHSSWLNQIEIYFSSVPRKALTPLDFASRPALTAAAAAAAVVPVALQPVRPTLHL